jgi:multiple sugar transport system substrate-binding protein
MRIRSFVLQGATGMSTQFRSIRWLAWAGALALVITACGPSGSPAAGESGAAEESADASAIGTPIAGADCPEDEAVTFWTSHAEPDVTSIRNIVETFNEQGGTCVTLVQVPGAETDVARLMTAVRGGTGPDVYMLDRFTVAERASAGVLTNLSDLGADDLSADYAEFAWAETQFDGVTWALPFDTDTRALYYRNDILEDAGVDPAMLDAANGPITIDQLTEIADQVDAANASEEYTVIGFHPTFDQGWHYTWMFANGGSIFDEGACQITADDPGVVAAFQFLYDWAERKDPQALSTWVSTYAPPDFPPAQHPFIVGQLGMMVTGDWFIGLMRQYAPDVEYGITYIPVPDEGMDSATWAGGWSLVIPTGSDKVDGAWEFMQYAAGEEGQRTYTEETAHLPTLNSVREDDSVFEERHLFFRDLFEVANNRPALPVGVLLWDSLTSAQDQVMLNEAQPEEALTTVQEAVQPQLDQFCPLS